MKLELRVSDNAKTPSKMKVRNSSASPGKDLTYLITENQKEDAYAKLEMYPLILKLKRRKLHNHHHSKQQKN